MREHTPQLPALRVVSRACAPTHARAGVTVDIREPDVMRVSPTPLYNTFADVDAFVERLKAALQPAARL